MRWLVGAAALFGLSTGLGLGYLVLADCYDCGGRGPRAARVQLMVLDEALQLFRLSEGRYLTAEEGLEVLCDSGAGIAGNGPILRGVPEDPWGHRYVYRPGARHIPGTVRPTYLLYSVGPDGTEATADDIQLESDP